MAVKTFTIGFSYLVDLVVILRVVLVYLFLLRKFKRSVPRKKKRENRV